MLGYAEAPRDLALGRVTHELRTGDLGRRGASGLYEIVGRRSRFLKLFGLRVDLNEVERILERGGSRALCTGTDERLIVAIWGDEAPSVVARMLAGRLGVPAASIDVRTIDEVPLLPSGKPDYAAVAAAAEPAVDRERTGFDAPGGRRAPGAEAASVAAVFCEVLDRDEVGEEETFSGLGGDSLSYVEMSLALEGVLGHLPVGWPEMSVRELAGLQRRRRRGTRVETNVVLRGAAVVLVVAAHISEFLPPGGAHVLLALAGHSFARFQLAATESPRRLARSASTITRIAVPASVWIGLMLLVTGLYSVGAVLLVNNYLGAPERTDGRWHYWFFEALVQILIVLTAVFSIPAVRRLERRYPFTFALILLGAALVFRFGLVTLGDDWNRSFRPHTIVWVFLLGWAAHRATTRSQRLVVSALVLACVPGFFGHTTRETIIVVSLLLLVWVPVLVVPRPASRVIGIIAAASMYIYLTHWQVWPRLADVMPLEAVLVPTLAVGIGAWLLSERLTALVRRAHAAAGALARRREPRPLRASKPQLAKIVNPGSGVQRAPS